MVASENECYPVHLTICVPLSTRHGTSGMEEENQRREIIMGLVR